MERRKKTFNPNIITSWKRLLTYLADLAIFLILSITIYSLVSAPIAKAITPFNKYKTETEVAYKATEDFLLDSKLIEIEDGKDVLTTEVLEKDAKRFISSDPMEKDGVFAEIFAYFYLDFANNKLTFDEPKTYDMSYVNIYVFKAHQEASPFMYDGGDASKLAVLRENYKTDLTSYFVNEEVNAKTQKAYDDVMEILSTAWNDATDVITESKEFINLANEYSKTNNNLLLIYSVSALITFVVLFFLYYLLVPALLGKGQTFAKKFLHVGVFYEDNKPIQFKTLLVRSILLFIFSISFYLVLPIFEIGPNFVNLPLFILGGHPVFAISPCFISFMCAGVSYIISCNSINHQSLHDLVLYTLVLKENPDIVDEEKKEDFNKEIEDGSSI